ncbi:hypothetical protein [Jannaschia donghaensis]|uniref:Uncharacterized protein n=1 Tax=Jannaschia donghaensis TaxID=420998 RepID=A0A0M6YD67_9RHOB|nr:hypothetical protein [Jannaschia donghaensis]CTQ48302.1 hypothetical protein JDO7802_00304 [Jannaschia donghaensis]
MTKNEHEALAYLIEEARKIQMTEDETTAQRRSFAYGNSVFENPNITKDMIDQEADRLGL